MCLIETVVIALWAMLPAYVPNNAAVLAGGGRPIDGGRVWGDRRVLGDGKTWRGTAVGTLVGAGLAAALDLLRPSAVDVLGAELPAFTVVTALTLAFGAMLGDISASFLKRRTGRTRGAPFPVVDQLDFVAGALVLTLIAAPRWFTDVFTVDVLAVVLLVTPVLHVGTNGVAYLIGAKEEPY